MNKTIIGALAALVAITGCSQQPPEKPASTANWLGTITKTSSGGMLKGNPKAKVKLVVYSALSCSGCARFWARSNLALDAYVAAGNVSYEFRNYREDITDLPATLISRCGDPKKFFPMTAQLFQNQTNWRGSSEVPEAVDADAIANIPPDLLATVLATKLGLDKFAQTQGVTAEQSKACLMDNGKIDELTKVTDVAKANYGVTELPAFLINGRRLDGAKTWEALEPALKAAGA